MAHKNLKIEKKKEYNPLKTQTVKRETVGKVKCYLRAVKPNPISVSGVNMAALYPDDYKIVYYYEVGANDGSYRKCRTKEEAERAFAQLVEFEKRQTEIN